MNTIKITRAAFALADGGIYEFTRTNNGWEYASDDISAHLTVTVDEQTADFGVLGAIRVSASVDGGCFSADNAIMLTVGEDIPAVSYMANYQSCPHWCRPAFPETQDAIPNKTQALLGRYGDEYGFILPVVDECYKTALRGGDVSGRSGMELYSFANVSNLCECETLAAVYAIGNEPYKLAGECAKYSLELLNNGAAIRAERRYPEIFEYLGWCSWDALEIRVSTEGLLEKCREFKEKNIPVKWAIIDDMWAECDNLRDIPDDLTRETGMFKVMHSSKLRSFEADPKRFPLGLRDCIAKIHEYGLKVGMWHPTSGYWSGIDPTSQLAAELRELLIETPNGRLLPEPELETAFLFYNAFHDFLKACGTDFVKIDNQGFIADNYREGLPLGKAARALQRAICSSVGAHFDNDIINCMGMASENMFNRPSGAVSRCSGDFLPENREWFIRHILACSYNSLVQGQFYWSDWDMWWTDDEQAKKNSVLRAISGGPIYVSDKIGRSRPEVFEPLCYSDGRILRCESPATPTLDCLTVDPEKSGRIFKVKNVYDKGGVIAAFNLDAGNQPVSGSICAADLGMCGEVAIYEHFSGEAWILSDGDKLDVTLSDHDDFRLYTIVPFDKIAVLGLIDKFNSPLAVSGGFDDVYSLYEGGEFAIVAPEGEYKLQTDTGDYELMRNGRVYSATLPLETRAVKIVRK